MSEIEDLREEIRKLKHGLEYYFRVADSERQRATSLRGECAHLEKLVRELREEARRERNAFEMCRTSNAAMAEEHIAMKAEVERLQAALTEQLRTRAPS